MTSTRRAPPVEIYHDPVPSYDQYSVHLDPESQALLQALRPITNSTTNSNYPVLNPTFSEHNNASPSKSSPLMSSPYTADYATLTCVSIPPPQQTYHFTDSPAKKPTITAFQIAPMPMPKPQKALFTTFPPPRTTDKENLYYPPLDGNHTKEYSDPVHEYKAPCKRPAIDAAPLRDMPKQKKMKHEDESPFLLPEPHQMPFVEDDGGKPPYSYATLIGMAILRAPNRRLTLAHIYKWISDTFAHYRATDSGWQNSIRHNLSLNKAFVKQERPKDDPGKGNYWAIQPGAERQFVKDKPTRRVTNPESAYFHSMQSDATRPSTAPCTTMFSFHPLSSTNIDSSRFPEDPEPSSDATIPASDPVAAPDDLHDLAMPPPSSRLIRSSPPPNICSSPPIARQRQGDGTPPPPPVPGFLSTSRSGGRKRKVAFMQDSGYFSSIESSALRSSSTFINNPLNLSSEADLDRPSIKPGRAEEEIARIRGSSYDPSPTKNKASIQQPTIHLPSSSPLRMSPLRNEVSLDNDKSTNKSTGMPPLTPGVVFKKPAKPPASVSPNTNLRNHRNRIRNLIGSPGQGLGMLGDDLELGWSPAFKFESPAFKFEIPEEEPTEDAGLDMNLQTVSNELFTANAFDADVLAARGSPDKKSAKRPPLERASTVANVLSDITGLSNNKLGTPFKFAKPTTGVDAKNPEKREYDENTPVKLPRLGDTPAWDCKDLFVELWSDGTDENAGMDILQGFRKIGEETFESQTKGLMARRSLARSVTSLF